jgi:hypothetical protein
VSFAGDVPVIDLILLQITTWCVSILQLISILVSHLLLYIHKAETYLGVRNGFGSHIWDIPSETRDYVRFFKVRGCKSKP